ncbi:mevalonate kinase [Lactococcus nasutitermitis]|uniref:phosphomevalonate kinase n=1 Tax=Lactococcus nasutitermitis TaxID=1652957 RepID=A0ABV9JBU3_9LACT|nr:phosphomevalonate kinase [Lactococcus nasutitermitis]
MSKEVTVKLPGKLFIAGEYAVTRPEHLALVTTIETDFQVHIAESQEKSTLHTNVNMQDEHFQLSELGTFQPKDEQWFLSLEVLKIILKKCGKESFSSEIALTIESDLGAGEQKKGYGSSAAVAVGVTEALNTYFSLGLTAFERYQIAGKAHFQIQGNGSLGDVAAISFGGSIFYKSGKNPIWEEAKILAVDIPWTVYVAQTGKAAKTSEKLEITLPDTFFEQSDELVIESATAIDMRDFDLFKEKLLENQLLLIQNIPEGYMTQKLALVLTLVNQHENLVGKISGAGFGENVLIFAKSEENIAELKNECEKNGIVLIKATISQEKI